MRMRYIDIAKGILIILIVLGHSGFPFTEYLYLFHVAAFVFLSGVVYKYEITTLKSQFKKLIKNLYLPYIAYQFVFYIILFVFHDKNKINAYSILNILFLGGNETTHLLGGLWYIVAFFQVSVIFTLIHKVASFFEKSIVIEGGISLLLFIFSNVLLERGITFPRHLSTALVLVLIFYLGVLYKNKNITIQFNLSYFLVCIVLLGVFNAFGKIDVGNNEFVNPLFFLSTTLLGVYCVIFVAKTLENKKIKIFEYIGKNTFTILALHFLAFRIINVFIVYIYSYPVQYIYSFPIIQESSSLWWLYTIFGIAFPLLAKKIISAINDYVKCFLIEKRG